MLEYPDERHVVKTTISLEETLILDIELGAGVIVDGMRLHCSHRRALFDAPLIGGESGERHWVSYDGHVLSSVYVVGSDRRNDDAASGIVFGFMKIDAFAETERLAPDLELKPLTPPIGGRALAAVVHDTARRMIDG